jgi:hypothetical protein
MYKVVKITVIFKYAIVKTLKSINPKTIPL